MEIIKLERIASLLFKPQHFLMYRGGSGGEFLISKIYQYSEKYKNANPNQWSITDVNKTKIRHPEFFELLLKIPQENKGAFNYLLKHDISDEIIDQAEEYLENCGDSTPLFRCHYINNSHFLSKSFLVYLDEERWFDYSGLLVSLKNKYTAEQVVATLEYHKSRYGTVDCDIADVSKNIIDFMNSSDMDKIHELYIYCLGISRITNNLSFFDILNMSPAELYFKYKAAVMMDYTAYRNDAVQKSVHKLISYSKYFDRGYLEDMFEISSTVFHDELIGWHENNLALLSENGVDHTQFKLA